MEHTIPIDDAGLDVKQTAASDGDRSGVGVGLGHVHLLIER
jgi:hypothetical protein